MLVVAPVMPHKSDNPFDAHLKLHVHIIVCDNPGIFPGLLHATHTRRLNKYNVGFQFVSTSQLNILQDRKTKEAI